MTVRTGCLTGRKRTPQRHRARYSQIVPILLCQPRTSVIADLPGIGLTTKGVERIILRITKELRERIAEPKVKVHDQIRREPEGFVPA